MLAGLLPAAAACSAEIATREDLLDHGKAGGPRGFYSVSGVKFTTASDVAGQVLHCVAGRSGRSQGSADAFPLSDLTPFLTAAPDANTLGLDATRGAVRRVARSEAAFSAEDLVMRRTNWAINAGDVTHLLEYVAQELSEPEVALTGGLSSVSDGHA